MALQFEDVNTAEQCAMYMEDLSGFPDLETAAALTQNYRDAFGSKYAYGFVLDGETVRNLLNQNGSNISGIRIYMGYDPVTKSAKAVAVATLGEDYSDFDIPVIKTGPTTALLAEGRPCPAQCGADNALNKSQKG